MLNYNRPCLNSSVVVEEEEEVVAEANATRESVKRTLSLAVILIFLQGLKAVLVKKVNSFTDFTPNREHKSKQQEKLNGILLV